MKKIIDRIVLGSGSPNKNDLWIDDRDGLFLKVHDDGEWKTIGGGSGDVGSSMSLAAKVINEYVLPTAPQPVAVYHKRQNKYHEIYDVESYFSHGRSVNATIIDSWEDETLETPSVRMLLYPSGTQLQVGMLLTPFYFDPEYPMIEGDIVFADEYIIEDSSFEIVEVTLNGKNYAAVVNNNV